MIYAHVVNGVVVNRILWDGQGPAPIDGQLIPEEQAEGLPSPPPPPPHVPESVPAHHLRRALRAFGMRDAVEAHIASLPADDTMRDDWLTAPYFRRDAVGIEAARVALGLTAAQVDALFVAAGHVVT